MNVVVIAPHPDDEAIGCGGSVLFHSAKGDRVVVVFLTSGELGLQSLPREAAWKTREAEATTAGHILGVSEIKFLRQPDWYVGDHISSAASVLRPIFALEQPELIYLPHKAEWHPDHRAALPVVHEALRDLPELKPALLMYEVWTPLGEFQDVRDITPHMAKKLKAIRVYRSQLGAFRYDKAIRGLNQYRGIISAKCRYAEVFGSPTP
jgi:LmbE family N-acetylglucosaminyl deacetylase